MVFQSCMAAASTPDQHRQSSSCTASEQFRCPLCSQCTVSHADLLCHLTNDHTEQLVAVCKLCRQLFPSDEIGEHAIRCKGVYVCPHCRATFSLPSYLRRHLARHRHASGARAQCDICGKTFLSTCALTQHRQVHTGEKPYTCKLCNAQFTQEINLKLHVDLHHAYVELAHAPKPFTCTVCGRGFLFPVGLQHHRIQHMKPRTTQKKFQCNACDSAFAYRSEYDRHCVTHSKKAMHNCPLCSKSFTRSSALRMHLLQHAQPSLLTCPVCMRIYASRSYLTRHMRKHEGEGQLQHSQQECLQHSHKQAASVSSLGSDASPQLADLVDWGTWSDDCRLDVAISVPEGEALAVEDMLLNRDQDSNVNANQVSNPAVPPDVNFLHSILYGSDDR